MRILPPIRQRSARALATRRSSSARREDRGIAGDLRPRQEYELGDRHRVAQCPILTAMRFLAANSTAAIPPLIRIRPPVRGPHRIGRCDFYMPKTRTRNVPGMTLPRGLGF